MEALLLGIYAFFVWLIFIKFKWLPWNTTSQVTVVIIPIVALTALVLTLNVVAPSSPDVRVVKYVVQVIPQVRGRVIEVPVEPNRLVKKGELLFRIDPTQYQNDFDVAKAKLAADEAKFAQAGAGLRGLSGEAARRTGVDQLFATGLQRLSHLVQVAHQVSAVAGREMAFARRGGDVLDRPAFGDPLGQAAVEHDHVLMAHGPEGPPDAGGRPQAQLVVDDHAGAVAEAQLADPRGELHRAGQHVGKRRSGV